MDVLVEIIKLLPANEFIEAFLERNSVEYVVCGGFFRLTDEFVKNPPGDASSLQQVFAKVDGLKDYLWEVLNTGHFANVSKYHRQLYTLVTLQKVTLMLMQNISKDLALKECYADLVWEINHGLLLGHPLDSSVYCNVLNDCLALLQTENAETSDATVNEEIRCRLSGTEDITCHECDIDVLVQPSIQLFKENYFDKSLPLILKGCMAQWPATSKWIRPNYLLQVCRDRIVPIEIGKNYTNANWSQDLVKFEEFFQRQLLSDDMSADHIEYLAQHNLFEQIPALRNDIIVPEYCCVTNNKNGEKDIEPDIKAWLGPGGTISPMHFDEKHNLLCQVFGYKRIILAAPSDSINLYPFEGEMLKNTLQIDAEHLDFEKFPLVRNVRFYQLTLNQGDVLYIPPKWWHYVRSLSKSFSVSFWWE